MAFPLDTQQLIGEIRRLYALLEQDGGYMKGIISGLSESPPITFHSQTLAMGRIARRRQLKIKQKRIEMKEQIDSPKQNYNHDHHEEKKRVEEPTTESELKHTKSTRKRSFRFFRNNDSDSEGSIKTANNLQLIEENEDNVTDDGDATETENGKFAHPADTSDVLTIDSDFGVPIDTNGKVVHNAPDRDDLLNEVSNSIDNTGHRSDLDGNADDDVYDDEVYDDKDDNTDDDDVSSSDSAFTDIETDSLLDLSLLNSYDESAASSLLDGDLKKRRKKRLQYYEQNQQSLQTPTPSRPQKPQNNRKMSFSFDKRTPMPPVQHTSSLSNMIQLKFKMNVINPLLYYLFVAPQSTDATASINVFISPATKPVLKAFPVKNLVPIVDLIGFLLWEISQKHDTEIDRNWLYDPNHWRLELADEDGESYGSFGVLERARVLSSYNDPHDLALCHIVEADEIIKNETQTPLPAELRQSMTTYARKRSSIDQLLGSSVEGQTQGMVQLTVQVRGPAETVPLKHIAQASQTVDEALRDFCLQQGLQPLKYHFREIVYRRMTDLESTPTGLVPGTYAKLLQGLDLVGNILGTLVLAPNDKSVNSIGENLLISYNITPLDSTFTVTPDRKNLEEKLKNVSLKDEKTVPSKPQKSTHVPKKRLPQTGGIHFKLSSNKYLDDIITGNNPQLPTNLNTIYFKWKVYRKKNTILNRIEKSLVLDGDYIHLTPSDDIVFKANPNDSPLVTQSVLHHHHHLYNYNNYYKELMMKTSSFHITQITKLKQYKNSKNPNHFKIVIRKLAADTTNSKEPIKKKYDLEAVNTTECEEIIEKLKWVLQIYKISALNA